MHFDFRRQSAVSLTARQYFVAATSLSEHATKHVEPTDKTQRERMATIHRRKQVSEAAPADDNEGNQ